MTITDMLIGMEVSDIDVDIPKDAETYMRLGAGEKLVLQIKLAHQEFYTGIKATDVLRNLEKPLRIEMYHLINKIDTSVQVLQRKDIPMSDLEVRYLIQYGHKSPKRPKYQSWYVYDIEKHEYILKGNDYVINK